jgi:hypothetical protein
MQELRAASQRVTRRVGRDIPPRDLERLQALAKCLEASGVFIKTGELKRLDRNSLQPDSEWWLEWLS